MPSFARSTAALFEVADLGDLSIPTDDRDICDDDDHNADDDAAR